MPNIGYWATLLGLEESTDSSIILSTLAANIEIFRGYLIDEDGIAALSDVWGKTIDVDLDIHPSRRKIKNWEYSYFELGGTLAAEVLLVPDLEVQEAPPTNANRLLSMFLAEKPDGMFPVNKDEQLVRLSNCVLIVNYKKMKSDQLMGAWSIFGTQAGASFLDGKFLLKNEYNIHPGSLFILDHLFPKLVRQAYMETNPRWRFLGFYRLFEHGYLTEVFEQISKGFYFDPKTVLSEASDKLSNEYSQFLNLVTSKSLARFFEHFADEFEKLKQGGNRFCWAIDRSITRKNKSEGVEAYPQSGGRNKTSYGVNICYRFRCAIVHAGSSDVVIDNFDDADAAILALLHIIEEAALNYIGLSPSVPMAAA